MRQSKQIKDRICKNCLQILKTDAKTIKNHVQECLKITELRKKLMK